MLHRGVVLRDGAPCCVHPQARPPVWTLLVGLLSGALLAAAPPMATRALAQRQSDAALGLGLQRSLYRDPALMGVEVQSVLGSVFLWGRVPNASALRRAEGLVRGHAGVREVRSHLRLDPAGFARIGDAELRAEIERRLEGRSGLRVGVSDGHVRLSGAVSDPRSGYALIESVRSVEGVRSLRLEQLRVGPGPPPAGGAPAT